MKDDVLILKAALCPPEQALTAWVELLNGGAFDSLDGKFYRALPTVYANLRGLGTKVPWLEQLKGTSRHAWAQNISRLHALMPLLQKLQQENIDYRLLKGAGIAFLTNAWSTRVMGDVDILFHKKDSKRVMQILTELGAKQKFNLPPSLYEPWTLIAHQYSTDLDIHAANTTDKSIFGRMLASTPHTINHQGIPVKMPAVEWILLHSCLHGRLENARSDLLQSTLDTARLLPLTNLDTLEKNTANTGVLDIIESVLRNIPALSPEGTKLLRKLQGLNLKNSKKHLRKLMFKNAFNWHNIKKLFRRIPNAELQKIARTQTNGKKWLYWAWLKTGQLNGIERICIEKHGGFLIPPAYTLTNGETITIAPRPVMQPNHCFTTGSIMEHDCRVRVRVPQGLSHIMLHFEYQFRAAAFVAPYINGKALGLLPLPGTRYSSYRIAADSGDLEISFRSPCNANEKAIDYIKIRCEWD